MANPVSRLKKRLARVQEDSIHYSVTSFIWKKYLESGKVHACKYWWVLFPTSLIVSALVVIVMIVLVVFRFFLGNLPNFDADEKNQEPFFSPHRRRADGRPWPRFIPAPYQVVAPVVLVVSLYVMITDYTWFTIYSVIVLVALAALGGIILLISKNWDQPVLRVPREVATRSIDSGWNRICPMLVIEPKHSDPEPDLIEPSESTA